METLHISFAPLVPLTGIVAWLVLGAIITLPVLRAGAKGGWSRLSVVLAGGLILANPVALNEERTYLDDIALIVRDNSPSQGLNNRRQQSDAAIAALQSDLDARDGLDVRTVSFGTSDDEETHILSPLNEYLSTLPLDRLSAIFMISDGQVHDADIEEQASAAQAPLHLLLSGDRAATDRRIIIDQAPAFAIVGRRADLVIRVEDQSADNQSPPAAVSARVRVRLDGQEIFNGRLPTGVNHAIPVVPGHRGQGIIDMDVEPLEGEMELANNYAATRVNAVRDRLRVLLVSGVPHEGERIWRSVLRSDPAVDLIHFTILRVPGSRDLTPVNQLALIPFPTQELFETSLDRFDLVIFDRYSLRGVLLMEYLENLANYAVNGGAILVASGPELNDRFNLNASPLGRVLPATPTGRLVTEPFSPRLTSTGRRHPITSTLEAESEDWGRWFRINESRVSADAQVLLEGADDLPLLVASRVGEGRVAQLMSDHIWMWGRGIEGGGPHRQLIRRTVHWLMKEPDLEEEALTVSAEGRNIDIERRSIGTPPTDITITRPDGGQETITLTRAQDGIASGRYEAETTGLYHFTDGTQNVSLPVGSLNSPEFQDILPTAERLSPQIEASGGGSYWLQDGLPDMRRINSNSLRHGDNWAGLPRRNAYNVDSIRQQPLLPPWLALGLLLSLVLLTWYRESRTD